MRIDEFGKMSGFRTSSVLENYQKDQSYLTMHLDHQMRYNQAAGKNFPVTPSLVTAKSKDMSLAASNINLVARMNSEQLNSSIGPYKHILATKRQTTPISPMIRQPPLCDTKTSNPTDDNRANTATTTLHQYTGHQTTNSSTSYSITNAGPGLKAELMTTTDLRDQINREQRFIERKLNNLGDFQELQAFMDSRRNSGTFGISNQTMTQSSGLAQAQISAMNNQLLAKKDMHLLKSQIQPQNRFMVDIPLSVRKMKLVSQYDCNFDKLGYMAHKAIYNQAIINMPHQIAGSAMMGHKLKNNADAKSSAAIKRRKQSQGQQCSAVSSSAKLQSNNQSGTTNGTRSKTVAPHKRREAIVASKRSSNSNAKFLRKNDKGHDSDPFVNEPIKKESVVSSPMRSQPFHNPHQMNSPMKIQQTNTQETNQPEAQINNKRLNGLMQLLERDLDGRRRTLQSQINKVDEVYLMTTEGTPKAIPNGPNNAATGGGAQGPYNFTNENHFSYTRASLRMSQSHTQDRDRQKNDDKKSSPTFNDNEESESIEAGKSFKFLYLRLFEAFRGNLVEYAINELLINDESDFESEISAVNDSCEVAGPQMFTFLSYTHQKMKHQSYRSYLKQNGCQCGLKNHCSPTITQKQENQATDAKTQKLEQRIAMTRSVSQSQILPKANSTEQSPEFHRRPKSSAGHSLMSRQNSDCQSPTIQKQQCSPPPEHLSNCSESLHEEGDDKESIPLQAVDNQQQLLINQRQEETKMSSNRETMQGNNNNGGGQQSQPRVHTTSSYKQHQKRSLPLVTAGGQNQHQAANQGISGVAILPSKTAESSGDYTPRGIINGKPQQQTTKVGARSKLSSSHQKRDIRVSQKGLLMSAAANNFGGGNNSNGAGDPSLAIRNRFTTEGVSKAQVSQNNQNAHIFQTSGRNNILSNSLQILSGTSSIEPQNASTNANQAQGNNIINNQEQQAVVSTNPEKGGYHLRYVSQGLQNKNNSIEGLQGASVNNNGSQKAYHNTTNMGRQSRKQGFTKMPSNGDTGAKNVRQSNEHFTLPPSKSINERLLISQHHNQLEDTTKKTVVSSVAINSKRLGGNSQNNLTSQQQQQQQIQLQQQNQQQVLGARHSLNQINNSEEQLVMQRSLNVTSNQNPVNNLLSDPQNQTVPNNNVVNQHGHQTMTFSTSEYGPTTVLPNNNHAQSSQERQRTFSHSYNYSNGQQQQMQQAQSKERKNVPLLVNQRQQMLASDYLVQKSQQQQQQQQFISDSQGFRSNNTTNGVGTKDHNAVGISTMPVVTNKQNSQNIGQSSFNQMPKNSQAITSGRSERQKINLILDQRGGQGRGDKMQNRQQQKSSNRSFQSVILTDQQQTVGVVVAQQINPQLVSSKQNLERALKTAQMGNSQRTRTTQLESNYNIWEAPLSQKFDFHQTAQHQMEQQHGKEIDAQQLILLQNMTPGQGRKPDFRQTTALPKSYKQFVATVNSQALPLHSNASLTNSQAISSHISADKINMYKTTVNNFHNSSINNNNYDMGDSLQFSKEQLMQAKQASAAQIAKKPRKTSQKDDIFKMISQLEFGDNSDTFRHLAKQFYMQNVQTKSSNISSAQRYTSRPSQVATLDGSRQDDYQLEDPQSQLVTKSLYKQQRTHPNPNPNNLSSQQQSHHQQQNNNNNTSSQHSKNGLQLTPVTSQHKTKQNHTAQQYQGGSTNKVKEAQPSVTEIQVLQKQLWQQFQLLRILKQTKYQQLLQKHQSRCDGSQPKQAPPGSQSIEYGFELTEEEMYTRLFLQQDLMTSSKEKHKNQNPDDDSQPYASFECPECVQMASLMLEEELRYYMQRSQHKKSKGGKSRDALFKYNGNSAGQPLKGIAGLSTQGVSLRNQKFEEEGQNFFANPGEHVAAKTSQGKRHRAQTQQNQGGKRGHNMMDDPQIIGQLVVNRAQPQIFFKKQLNQNFRQVIRGEQLTAHMKQQSNSSSMHQSQGAQNASAVCNCRSGPYMASNNKHLKPCTCGVGAQNALTAQQAKRNYEEPPIPFQYGFQQRLNKPKFASHKQSNHGKSSHGQSGAANHATAGASSQSHQNEGGTQNQHSSAQHHSNNANEHKVALDGTVTGHKRKYKPATGIFQPPLQPFKHLNQSPINQTISKVNDLVLILFKQKMKSSDQQIIKLFKYFGIPVPRGNGVVLDQKLIRMPDFLHSVNQKLLIKLYKVFNQENNGVKPESSTQIFRFYVGKGNNYPSVRQIISRRTWWNRGNQKQEKFYGQKPQGYFDNEEVSSSLANGLNVSQEEQQQMSSKQFSSGCHFIWTQWRKTEHHEFLKRVNDDQKKQKDNEALLGGSTKANNHSKKKKMQNFVDPKLLKSAPLSNVPTLIYNRLDDNYHLSNKKALFLNVSTYYQAMGINPFEVAIPLTFNVKSIHNNDQEYTKFTRAYKEFEQQKDNNIWIIKPGENSNRGTGIQVAQSFNEIKTIIQQLSSGNGGRTSIVQKYLDKPLLINNRKFDIRGYAMMTSVGGVIKGYMYRDCYFRTSSKQFDLTNLHSRFVHLTNDAIQMNSEDYGRFESGNKLSINDFQRYLDANHTTKNVCFMRDLFPQMERLATDSFRAVGAKIDPKRVGNCFEIFGYDFMIDENFKVFLIEANTNPCLEICSPLLARIIPELLDNSFRIAIDPLYQPAQFLAKLKEDGSETNNINQSNQNPSFRDCSVGVTINKDKAIVIDSAKGTGAAAEGDNNQSPSVPKRQKESANQASANQQTNVQVSNQKRQRLELLTQIKYTLIYDERIDKPVVDKILADYDKKLKQQALLNQDSMPDETNAVAAQEGGTGQTMSEFTTSGNDLEGAQVSITIPDDNAMQLLREIVEEEKLDEQAAKKEEIEAAEDEAAGIMPKPLMMQPLASAVASEEDDEDESEDELFH